MPSSWCRPAITPHEQRLRAWSPQVTPQIHVDVGGTVDLQFRLTMAGASETVTVSGAPPLVETVPSAVSAVIDEKAINDLPLNGRRFTDLSLLAPGAFGGIRGYQSSYLVDGADNNNAFFGQTRGRYRAPYQFSNEVVQEFRVSSNTYGAELGREEQSLTSSPNQALITCMGPASISCVIAP